jgi:tRNA pseudouridine38-40 synthase
MIYISVEADGFLRYMVRTIVGTLVDVGRGKRSAEEVAAILAARDRRRAGLTAPPQGLYLKDVKYQ